MSWLPFMGRGKEILPILRPAEDYYLSRTLHFVPVVFKGRRVIRKTTGWTCKDHVLDAFIASRYAEDSSGYDFRKVGPIHEGTDGQLCFGMWLKAPFAVLKEAFDGFVRVCQIIESECRWEGRTNAFLMTINSKRDKYGAVLRSPLDWARTPQLLSLYLTLARVITKTGLPLNVDNLDKLDYYLDYLYRAQEQYARREVALLSGISIIRDIDPDLNEYLPLIRPCLLSLLRNEKKIFDSKKDDLWPRLGHGDSGIVKFCEGGRGLHPAFENARKRLMEVMKNEQEKVHHGH